MSEILKDTTANKIGTGDGGLSLDPAGTETVTISNGIVIPDGTKAAPAIRLSDDTNTGIYSPTNDSISFVANGEDGLRVTGSPSAVNYAEVVSSATGADLVIKAVGSDANIDIDIQSKGSGQVLINGSAPGGGSSPLTTKGDVYTYSTADARLPVGTDGQVLTADSAEATGLKWASGGGGASVLNDLTDVNVGSAAVSARYWRLQFTENYGAANQYTGVAEVEFKTSSGGSDVTTGGTPIAGASHASYPVANAFDDDQNTDWLSAIDDYSYVGYDFGSGNDVAIVEYTVRPRDTLDQVPTSWNFQYSSDGSNWTTVATESDQSATWGSYETRTFTGQTGFVPGNFITFDGTNWSAGNVSVSSDNIDAGSSLDGYVLTSDGSGNAVWESAGGVDFATYGSTIVTSPNATGDNTLVMGDGANANANYRSIVIGRLATINSVASGTGSYDGRNVLIGDYTQLNTTNATQSWNVVIGAEAGVVGGNAGIFNNVFVGSKTKPASGTYSDTKYCTVVGDAAYSLGNGNVVLGANSRVGHASSNITNSIAIGNGTWCYANNSIVISTTGQGESSVTDQVKLTTGSTNVLKLKDLGRLHLEGTQAGYVAPGFATGSEPTAVAGQIIYDSTTNKLKFYNGSSWETITSA